MITKQIIHNSEGAAEAEIISLKAKVKHVFNSSTLEYHNVVKHPTQNKWATRYMIPEAGDDLAIRESWKIVEAHLNPTQIGNLVEITEDWKTEDIL